MKGYVLGVLLISFLISGCKERTTGAYFFLKEYPELTFIDKANGPIPAQLFISRINANGASYYQVQDPTLRLVYRKDKTPYSGYIRTYDWDVYNVEGVFRNGYIERLRFWHPNRQLGMDADFVKDFGQVWSFNGNLLVEWTSSQTIYRNALTNKIKELHEDSMSTYFDKRGDIRWYTVRGDSASISYYADGKRRSEFPNGGNGRVRRWYSNGILAVQGEFRNGEISGTWVEYDSTGNEIKRESY